MADWLADLHIHSLLSPCADIEMTPHHIVRRAGESGVNLLAITDHNVSANVLPAVNKGQEYGVVVWPGVEVECQEGAHIVVLFDGMRKLNSFQQLIDKNMSGLQNNPEKFGGQFVVDENDDFVREEERLLLAPVNLSASQVVTAVDDIGGICVAAHIDRPSYSLLTYLGFLPPDAGFAAAEISRHSLKELTEKKLSPLISNLPYLTNSDAHTMEEFLSGPKNLLVMEEPTIKEFKLALMCSGGRRIEAGKFIAG